MIREATQADVFDLVVLTRDFMKEAGKFFKFNKDKTEQFLVQSINHPDYAVFVLDLDSEIKGMLVAQASDHFLLGRKVAFEIGWYVNPEKRGRTWPIRLIQAFEEWGKSKEVDSLILADIPHLTDLHKLYSKLSYSLHERSYIKVI